MAHLILGCGYLGERVARLLLDRGERVFANTRKKETAARFQSQGIEPILCDVLEAGALKGLPAFDAVVYSVGWDRSSGASMREVYVEGLERVLSRLAAPRKWIHVSSTSVYGQADGVWVDEQSPTEPLEESGRIVLEAEGVLRRRLPGAVVLRFSGIYGPGRLLRQKTIEAGESISGDPEKWLNVIQVEDGARVVLAAWEKAAAGWLCNVCDGAPVKRRAFFGELARLLNAPAPRFVLPAEERGMPPHESANRRIGNRRMREGLRVELRYEDYRAGLRGSVE